MVLKGRHEARIEGDFVVLLRHLERHSGKALLGCRPSFAQVRAGEYEATYVNMPRAGLTAAGEVR